MKTYLVLGGNGQLGQALRKVVPENVTLVYPEKRVDITSFEAVRKAIMDTPNINGVINCAAYTAVDKAETDVDAAMAVNLHGAANIAAFCKAWDIDMVHISTDYVFNSDKPLFHQDEPNPINVYGLSKSLGEAAVHGIYPKAFIIRTASVYSEFGNNFLKTMVSRYNDGQRDFSVVADQTSRPTYAPDLAKMIFEVLDTGYKMHTHILHYSGNITVSWHQFAKMILTRMPESVIIHPTSAASYNAAAMRPAKSILITSGWNEPSSVGQGIEESLAVLLNKERE